MKRKEFIRLSAMAAALAPLDSIFATRKDRLSLLSFLQVAPRISPSLQRDVDSVMEWLRDNGWVSYLKNTFHVDLNLNGDALQQEFIKEIDPQAMGLQVADPGSGFDDFAGMHLIQPGVPSLSLLYHALASPRVRPAMVKAYPELSHLDVLENYIYALADWSSLKNTYGVMSNEDLVLAVFAYEYRPAFKTPHHQHADLVFSRTGVARVGQHGMNYDSINRCFVNQPVEGLPVQHSAVVPARYGVFIARRVKAHDIDLMTTGIHKPGDEFDDKHDDQRSFLQPIRKVFNHDVLFDENQLQYQEMHKSEKLAKLVEHTDLKFYRDLKPTVRDSSYLIVQDDDITHVHSSFLVVSKPAPLIRLAKEGDRALYFLVPKMIPGEDGYSENRYFTSFNTQNVQDVELLVKVKGTKDYQKIPNEYTEPRTQPLFLNISHQQDTTVATGYKEVLKDSGFEDRLNEGQFYSPLFEDSICEGTVTASIGVNPSGALRGLYEKCLPAFSIVTAPDFFPQVDNFDLMEYDVAPGKSKVISSFYEGGVATLATCRLTPNPKWIPPDAKSDHQTYTAVLSPKPGTQNRDSGQRFNDPTLPKGYLVSGFLPDVASSVFAPGWDITYSADKKGSTNVYLSTEGLGSPFVEDMKLCAAANGMWPASSPDAARTYQGSLDPWSRNATAIPLMDNELGFHKNSPACRHAGEKESHGWDGVQGPFLENRNGKWMVNFADIGRSDVVQNALDGNVDLSKLRQLTSAELISRMACLKKCVAHMPKTNFKGYKSAPKMVAFTTWWLISAEPVDFGAENAKGWGIPKNLIGADTRWVTDKANARVKGKGYLYVFVDAAKMTSKNVMWDEFSRRLGDVPVVYVCQVVDQPGGSPLLAQATIKSGKVRWAMFS